MKTTCLITEDGRECSKCSTFKIWACFSKNKGSALGYSSACNYCISKDKKTPKAREVTENKIEGQQNIQNQLLIIIGKNEMLLGIEKIQCLFYHFI